MHDHRTLRNAALLVAAAIFAVSCAMATRQALATGASSPPSGKVVLKIGWTEEPDNLNPFVGYMTSAYEVWSLQYDYLFNPRPDGTHGAELAAERPTTANGGISDGGRVWTVHIRPGVKWQDGQPLTADDVAFTYNYIVQNRMLNWTMVAAGITKAIAVDPTTVKLICSAPKADMLDATIPIVPKHIWQQVKPDAAQSWYQNKPPIIGSGPFQVVRVKKGSYVKLERNPLYWGKTPTVDEIVFETYQNADTMTQDLKMGTIDAAQGLLPAQFTALRGDKRFGTVAYNFLNWNYIAFNCSQGPSKGNPVLRDPAFRRALVCAIDQNLLVASAYGGLAEPGTTVITPHTWSNPDYHWEPPADARLTFDLGKAKQMLDAAGYKDSNGDGIREDHKGKPISLRLWALADDEPVQAEGKLITGWWKQLDIGVTLAVLERGALDSHFWNYEGNTYVPDYDCYIDATLGFLDPGETLPWFTTAQIGNWNEACWSNAEFDKLCAEQAGTMDRTKRAQLTWRAQELMYENAVYPILTYPKNLQAYNTERWTGWTPLKLAGSAAGPVFYSSCNIDTYLNLRPAKPSHAGDGTTRLVVTVIVAAAVALAIVVTWLVIRGRRRRRQTLDEA